MSSEPAFSEFRPGIVKNNTPENFKAALLKARDYADRNGCSLITVNSWNEWTETSYLEPDNLYGYGYRPFAKTNKCEKKPFSDGFFFSKAAFSALRTEDL